MLTAIIPGVSQVLVIFWDQDLRAFRWANAMADASPEELDVRGAQDKITKLRRNSRAFEWLAEDEMPFIGKPLPAGQIDIFSALRKEVLFLSVPGRDGQQDLVFIHLSGILEESNVKGIRKGIDPSSREFIGLMARNTLTGLLDHFNTQDHRLDDFFEQTRKAYHFFRKKRAEYDRTGLKYADSLVRLAESHLREISAGLGQEFKLSKDAIQLIRSYPDDLSCLLEKISGAVDYYRHLYPSGYPDEILVDDWFLAQEAPVSHQVKTREDNARGHGHLSRTLDLLDKLEQAAEKARANALKLTSENVGRMCPVPISAPAISDSIRNHRSRIIRLIARYPDKWPIIRQHFRPIVNALEMSGKETVQESA